MMHKFYAHPRAHKHTQTFVHIKNLEVQISVLIHKSQSTFTDSSSNLQINAKTERLLCTFLNLHVHLKSQICVQNTKNTKNKKINEKLQIFVHIIDSCALLPQFSSHLHVGVHIWKPVKTFADFSVFMYFSRFMYLFTNCKKKNHISRLLYFITLHIFSDNTTITHL